MIELIRVAADLQAFCDARRWRFCFIGGLALQRWGEPRETIDVDLTLLTGFDSETPFVEALLERYAGRIDDAADFARANRVLLLRSASGVGIDVALGALPFEESVVARATRFAFPGDVALRTCSAEDLVVLKAFAARERDWVDVEGVVVRQAGALDWTYVDAQLRPLAALKDAPEILTELARRRAALA